MPDLTAPVRAGAADRAVITRTCTRSTTSLARTALRETGMRLSVYSWARSTIAALAQTAVSG